MATFARGDVIVRDDGKYPEGALVVDGLENDGCLLAHPAGGGLQLVIPADEVRRFERVDDQERISVFSPGTFSIEGMEGEFSGWSDGSSWNGWEQPCFTREVSMQVLEAAGRQWSYDERSDEFVVSADEDEAPERYCGQHVQLGDGGTVTAYFVGAGSWIWDKAS